MAYEDVDYCLRAWEAGLAGSLRAALAADARWSRTPAAPRSGERELRLAARTSGQSGATGSTRATCATPDGQLRIVYVTEDTGVGGGHRDVFEHLNRLAGAGHEVELYSLGGPPDWFALRGRRCASSRTTRSSPPRWRAEDAIKVATWWDTAPSVWRARCRRGIPVYFVQDIETSYYPGDEATQNTCSPATGGVPLPDDLGLEPRAARASWA